MGVGQNYVLGHDDGELKRLALQAAVFGPVTRRLIDQSGIRPGMRVLDLGCGSGAVGLAAAGRYPDVAVHAMDSNPRAIDIAI